MDAELNELNHRASMDFDPTFRAVTADHVAKELNRARSKIRFGHLGEFLQEVLGEHYKKSGDRFVKKTKSTADAEAEMMN